MPRNLPCTIRFWEVADAPGLFEAAWQSREQLMRWMQWCHPNYRVEESREWIERQVEARADGSGYEFAIIDGRGRIAGGCGLNTIETAHRRANLGYWVRTSNTGQGIASCAVRLLANWAFETTDLIRLEIVVATENHASQRVAEKAGADREGLLADRLMLREKAHDAVMYAFVRSRWRAACLLD